MPRKRKPSCRVDCFIGLEVDFQHIDRIAAQLADCDEIRYVGIAIGPYDVIVAGSFGSDQHLLEFLKRVATFEGVKRSETSHVLQTLKRTCDWTPPEPWRVNRDGRGGQASGL